MKRLTGRQLITLTLFVSLLAYVVYKSSTTQQNNSAKIKQPLTIAFDTKIIAGDPRFIGTDPASQYLEELRFLSLISFDKQGNITYILAKKIKQEEKHVTITMKSGIHFANGQEINAYDAVATYNAVLNSDKTQILSPRRSAFNNVLKIEALNSKTLSFELKEKDAAFIANLVIGILPKSVAEAPPQGNLEGKDYESGAFKLTKVTETSWELTRNEKFDFSTKAKLKGFVVKIIPDTTTRYAALMKGDIDLIQNSLDPDKVELIESSMQDKFNVLKQPRLALTYIGFNFRNQTAANPEVRKAIYKAIDRVSLIKYRMRSSEQPATGLFPPGNFYEDKSLTPVSYSPEEAKKELIASGLTLPIPLSLKVSSANRSLVEITKNIAALLSEVGFNAKVESLENSLFQDQIKKGQAQVWVASWVGFKDPDILRFVFASDMVPPNGGNRGAYSNKEVDVLLKKGREEFDPMKRREYYNKVQEILNVETPFAFLWHGSTVAVFSRRVKGYELYADGRYASLTQTEKIE